MNSPVLWDSVETLEWEAKTAPIRDKAVGCQAPSRVMTEGHLGWLGAPTAQGKRG